MELRQAAVLGVAGNMTGHLEQAGEAGDFVAVRAGEGRPKGMFPVYLPGVDHRLGVWPFSSERLVLPSEPVDVQPEPEVALRCRLEYDADGVCGLVPLMFAAADDTSQRRPASRIHHKKNWGSASKGLSDTWIALERFDAESILHRFRLACWLVRDGECHPYGEDSWVRAYGTHYGELVDWMIERLRNQREEGPLDDVGGWLDRAHRPIDAVICIGATRYTAYGEGCFVQPGDEVVVALYDSEQHQPDAVADAVAQRRPLDGRASVLRRTVVPSL